GTITFSTSCLVLTGLGNQGPSPGFISTSIFIACGTTRISLKRIAASGPIWLIGITVISVASSGVRHRVKKSYLSFSFIKSGRYRPAWRIIHTGGRSTVSPFKALRKRSFLILLKFFYHLYNYIF